MAEKLVLYAHRSCDDLSTVLGSLNINEEHEAQLQAIIQDQYLEGVVIDKRYNKFLDKVKQFPTPTGISLEATLVGSQSAPSAVGSAVVQKQSQLSSFGKISTSIPGCPDKLAWNYSPSSLSVWFDR